MLENKNLYNFIGLCKKARKLVTGLSLCENGIRKKKVKLVIVAKDAGKNTKKDINNICNYYKVGLIEFGTGDMLGKVTGNEKITVIGIIDEGFKKEIVIKINNLGDNK